MANVTKVLAREIFDSRGNPTVEVEVSTSKGMYLRQDRDCVIVGLRIYLNLQRAEVQDL
jgi:hypothetical protein